MAKHLKKFHFGQNDRDELADFRDERGAKMHRKSRERIREIELRDEREAWEKLKGGRPS